MFAIPLIVVFCIAVTFYASYVDKNKNEEENENVDVFDSLENNEEI